MTELTAQQRAEMRAAAEAATPGLWYRTGAPWFLAEDAVLAGSPDGNVGFVIADCDCFSSRDEYEGDIQLARPEDDAAHIVAACPANVIALLDLCDRLEKERDVEREHASVLASALVPFARYAAAEDVEDGEIRQFLGPPDDLCAFTSIGDVHLLIGDLRRAASALDAHRAREGGGG